MSALFAILSLFRVYTICHYQQSDQGLQNLPFFLTSIIKDYTFCHLSAVWWGSTLFLILSRLIPILSSLIMVYPICHFQSYKGLQYLSFSTVWSGSTLFAILSSLFAVYTVCHSQSDQCLQYLPFSAVGSGSKLFAILESLIRVYTVCNSDLSDQDLHDLPLSVWSTLYYLPFSEVW